MPAIGPYRVRSYLEQNEYYTDVIDFYPQWNKQELLDVIEKKYNEKFLFIGISSSFLYFNDVEFAQEIKKRFPNVKIVLGGANPWLEKKTLEATDYIDLVIYGHAENALLEYLKWLDGTVETYNYKTFDTGMKYVIAEHTYPYKDTENLTVKWKSTDPIKYVKSTGLEISRGCIFKCKFCSYPLIGKKRFDYIRSVDNLSDEIKRNWEEFGLKTYLFADDTFNDSTHKLEQVYKAIRRSNVDVSFSSYLRVDLLHRNPEQIELLNEMGLHGANFGIESWKESTRKTIGKGLKNEEILDVYKRLKNGNKNLWINTYLIAGLPGETVEDMEYYNQWMIENAGTLFDSWYWHALYIVKKVYLNSEFALNPEKYGYDTYLEGDLQKWRSRFLDFDTALVIADELNNKANSVIKTLSFDVTALLGAGYTFEEIHNKTFDKGCYNPIIKEYIENYKRV